MDELLKPSLAIVNRLARVVFQLGVIGVKEAADAGMSSSINVQQLAVFSQAASPPDVDLGLGIDFARRQFDRGRKHICCGIRVHPGPGRLAAEMRLGEVSLAADIEQVLDPVEVKKERIAAAAGEKSVVARFDDV